MTSPDKAASPSSPVLSVVIPLFNEEDNVVPLACEIVAALQGPIQRFEILFVDDASTDKTVERLSAEILPDVRILRHRVNAGQSAAVATGFHQATGEWVVTLDGDGQNDPSDIPAMFQLALMAEADCVTGVRIRRQDTRVRRMSSKIANSFRNAITGDRIIDSGCGIRVMKRASLREVPVFNGMHRFLPTLMRAQGLKVLEYEVNHRERTRGVSKYGVGNRLWRGIRDCFGVRWYGKRSIPSMRL